MDPRTYILATMLLNAVYAAPQLEKKPDEVVILEQENNFNGVDPWRWSNVTSYNQSIEDYWSAMLPENDTWTSPDGITYNITYTEDGEPVLIPLDGEDAEMGEEPELEEGAPGGAEDPGKSKLSGNAALTLIGRRK